MLTRLGLSLLAAPAAVGTCGRMTLSGAAQPVVANRNGLPTHKGHAPAALGGSPALSVGRFLLPPVDRATTNEPLSGWAGAFDGSYFVVARQQVACQTGWRTKARSRCARCALPRLKAHQRERSAPPHGQSGSTFAWMGSFSSDRWQATVPPQPASRVACSA